MSMSAGLLLAAALAAPVKTAPAPALRTRVERALAQARAHEGLQHALWSIEVRSLSTGRVLYARDADASMMPASAMKLATTAAALDAFGPDARFRTTVQAAGNEGPGGVLSGDLYLVGSGDPSLSRELVIRPEHGMLELLADTLYQAGVRRVEGKIIGADVLFSGDRRGADWTWGDLVWWYGAEVSALTFADGSLNLKITPGAAPGAPLVVERHPATDYVGVISKATTCAPAEPPGLVLTRAFGRNQVELSGCLPPASPTLDRWVAVEDPAAYAAAVFAETLKAKGIEVAGGTASGAAVPSGLRVLASYDGAPMADILKDVNKLSHNLRAEMLLRLVGHKVSGVGTAEAGRDAVLAFLSAQGVDTHGWDMEDGSGLSRSDLVTAHGFVDLLAAMDKHPLAARFRDSLPVAGVDGTLERRLGGARTRGLIQAKTGTLNHTGALAGYAAPAKGERLAFAILVNHAIGSGTDVRQGIDLVTEALFAER
jgi:D-alanyl-D-alanine carboxypeptidase/D-alanyl-D-alanine-endopeptidase (penicillin-binding protein 4)